MAKRQGFWIDNLLNTSVAAAGDGNDSLFTGTPPINTRGVTITRIVLDLALMSITTAGAFGVQAIDIGIGMTSQEAFNAGVFPDPRSDERPVGGWMFRTRCVVAQNGVGTNILYECHRDIRSGRKVSDGEAFIVFNSANILGTTFTVQVVGVVRCLVLLP